MGKLFGWLNRSYAETAEAYNTRMNRLPVLHAGYVFFDWVNYDVATHSFSVYIEWNGELNQKLRDSMPQGGYAFRCSEEQAACYTREHNGSPVYVKLHAKCGRLYVKNLYFNSADKQYELFFNGCDVIPPEMVCFWGRGPVEKMDFSSYVLEETEHDAVPDRGEPQGSSYRGRRSSFHGSRSAQRGSYRSLGGSYRGSSGSYRSLGGSYRSIFGSYHGLRGSYRSIFGSYRGIAGSYRSIWTGFLGMGGSYRGMFGSYRSISGSYRSLGGSYRSIFGSYRSLGGSYRSISGSYRSLGGSYRNVSGSYRGLSGSYQGMRGSHRSLAGSYRSAFGSYRSLGGSYRDISGSYLDFDGYAMDEIAACFGEQDNMVDNTLGYGLDLIW